VIVTYILIRGYFYKRVFENLELSEKINYMLGVEIEIKKFAIA